MRVLVPSTFLTLPSPEQPYFDMNRAILCVEYTLSTSKIYQKHKNVPKSNINFCIQPNFRYTKSHIFKIAHINHLPPQEGLHQLHF